MGNVGGFIWEPGAGGGGAPTGNAGGDLGSTYPNPTVVSVANVTTGVLAPANGGAGPVFSTAVTGTSMPAGSNSVATGFPVTMVTPAAAGSYRFVVELIETAAGSGGTCTTGAIGVSLSWKDADTAVVYALSSTVANITFTQATAAAFNTAVTMVAAAPAGTTTFMSSPKEFRAAAGTAIQYQVFTSTGNNCTTPTVFATRPALYYMGY